MTPGLSRCTLSETPTIITTEEQQITVKCIPMRIVDGDLDNTLTMGFPPPTPTIDITQIDGSATVCGTDADTTGRSTAHTANWYTSNYPIPFQYGVSKYDNGTGVESPMSALSDLKYGLSKVSKSTINQPLGVDITGLAEGGYALFRVGGTSSIIKKLGNFVIESPAITIITSGTCDIKFTEGNIPSGYKMRLRFYSYNNTKYAFTNGGTAGTSGTSSWYTKGGSALEITLFESTDTNLHHLEVYVEIQRTVLKDPFERVYVAKAFSWNGNTSSQGTGCNFDMVDFTPPRALIDLQPIEDAGQPPKGMKYLTEVNNFFFGVLGKILYISDFARPNSWPTAAYLEFEEDITGLGKRGSDLLVFTGFGLFRVFGSTASSMRKIRVPTIEGCPVNMHNCIKEVTTGTMYVSHYGICLFDGAQVTNITNLLLRDFILPANTAKDNRAEVFEDKYYLLGPDKDGWIVDLKGAVKVLKTTMRESSLRYRGVVNKLFSTAGYLGGGSTLAAEITTREFDGGDINAEKLFRQINISGQSLACTVTVTVDGVTTDTVAVSLGSRSDATIHLGDARRGNVLQVIISTLSGTLQEIGVVSDIFDNQLRRYTGVTLRYVGAPTIDLLLDGATKRSSVELDSTTVPSEAFITFPAMSEGLVPHITTTETDSNRILSTQYQSEEV